LIDQLYAALVDVWTTVALPLRLARLHQPNEILLGGMLRANHSRSPRVLRRIIARSVVTERARTHQASNPFALHIAVALVFSSMLTIRQLRYFDALARCQHFGRAAEECAVSQPALSMQIRELEQFLGTELFERRSGAVILTEAGVEIAQRAAAILSATRDLIDLAQHRNNLLSGSLCLGVIPTLAPYLLPYILPRLQREHPALRLDLVETQTKVLLGELTRGALDVLLMALPVDNPDLVSLHVLTDRFLLAVPADDPLPENARVTPSDVEKRKLILLEEGHCLRDQALDYCTQARSRVNASLGATSLATIMQMVACGYGVTLVPEVAIDVELRDDRVKLLRFAEPQPSRSVGLVWRRTSPRELDFKSLGQIIASSLNGPPRQDMRIRE
jgi:LysR family hydrogen peroxide-inducible transcriptional activator